MTWLEAGRRDLGLFQIPAPALEMLVTDRPKEMRVGRPETQPTTGGNHSGSSSDTGRKGRRDWSPQVFRKTLKALGEA